MDILRGNHHTVEFKISRLCIFGGEQHVLSCVLSADSFYQHSADYIISEVIVELIFVVVLIPLVMVALPFVSFIVQISYKETSCLDRVKQ